MSAVGQGNGRAAPGPAGAGATPSDAHGPEPDLSGFDRPYMERFLAERCGPILKGLFRMKVEGLDRLDLKRPGILAGNHNWGLWGISEVLGFEYAWYLEQRERPPDLIAQGGPELQQIPVLNTLVRRAGIVVASMNGMLTPLRQGRWVLIQPGAVVDQGRPIWMRRRSRIKKVSWVGERRVLTDTLGYVAAAAEGGYPIYPVAWSGTHELAPILFESTRLLRWSGIHRMRREENLPSFPITLNHLINLGAFLLTPLRRSPAAWAAFALANVYVDWVFAYPIFPFQLRIKVGDPIEVPDLSQRHVSVLERQRIYRDIHARVVKQVDEMLVELDEGRPWVHAGLAAQRAVSAVFRRGAAAPANAAPAAPIATPQRG
jgi:1-acyl-sn-glycerol-3-phosphate acyltransferase